MKKNRRKPIERIPRCIAGLALFESWNRAFANSACERSDACANFVRVEPPWRGAAQRAMAGAWLISDLVLTVQLAESRKVAEVGHGRVRVFSSDLRV